MSDSRFNEFAELVAASWAQKIRQKPYDRTELLAAAERLSSAEIEKAFLDNYGGILRNLQGLLTNEIEPDILLIVFRKTSLYALAQVLTHSIINVREADAKLGETAEPAYTGLEQLADYPSYEIHQCILKKCSPFLLAQGFKNETAEKKSVVMNRLLAGKIMSVKDEHEISAEYNRIYRFIVHHDFLKNIQEHAEEFLNWAANRLAYLSRVEESKEVLTEYAKWSELFAILAAQKQWSSDQFLALQAHLSIINHNDEAAYDCIVRMQSLGALQQVGLNFDKLFTVINYLYDSSFDPKRADDKRKAKALIFSHQAAQDGNKDAVKFLNMQVARNKSGAMEEKIQEDSYQALLKNLGVTSSDLIAVTAVIEGAGAAAVGSQKPHCRARTFQQFNPHDVTKGAGYEFKCSHGKR